MAGVLVVGATSAIAAEIAALCADRGDRLYLLARSSDKLDGLRESLNARWPSCVVGAEAGDFNELDANADRILRAVGTLGTIDIAFIAHGLLGDQVRSEEDVDTAWRTISTNYVSAVSMIIPIANHMESKRAGHLAVLSSVAGERGRPRNYTYGSAKAGVNVYLQGVRSRLWSAGVGVHILQLGPVNTPMTADHPKNPLFAEPESVARSILRSVDRNRHWSYHPWFWRPIMALVRQLPEPVFQRISFLSGR